MFGKTGNSKPQLKVFATEKKDFGEIETNWWDGPATTTDAIKFLEKILPGNDFDNPKPVELVEKILKHTTRLNSIVLDSFAGSGTTAHAVLRANAQDGGNRKFILVECEDYADCLTAERVRRVINGYDFTGTQREELLRKSLTFTDLKKADKLLDQIAGIENLDGHRFDSIEKKVKDGELVVEGVRAVKERAEGLGGSFTYCTLGEAVDMDRLLRGEALPGFMALGAVLFHMATSEAFDPAIANEKDGHGYLGESPAFHVWLIYKPDLDFLKSREAALTLSKAKALVEEKPGKRHLVFAPARFVSQKLLDEAGLPVEFAPLPFALYRVERR
ncbi:MAG: site-specific DNA-methyltransferase [Flavobacteriales bacterium]|nr:site-specific DNA-methyltransferase [Flavobacteriales bacterium]